MSKSTLLKLALAVIFLIPASGHAAELKFNDKTWTVDVENSSVVPAVHVRNDFPIINLVGETLTGQSDPQNTTLLAETTVAQIETMAAEINRPTKRSMLVIKDDHATEFEPGQDGLGLDVYKLRKQLEIGSTSDPLPVLVSYSQSSLAETNNLGITELVAVGESDFAGSPRNRVVNIKVGADKFNGIILKPGQEFSFNTFLGDVDAEHGFLPELVIKRSGLVPEFGGGLCQVSSTAFRAAMNAGNDIVERRNHSFAVRYYAPQGTDATIYPGSTDFRFTNDLASHLLIRTRIDGNKLYFEFYGTKDDRKVTFDGPYQYDKQANGAMKAVWTRWVEQNGEKKEQVFRSTYQPPALFTQTTQPSTPNPAPTPETPGQAPVPDPEPVPVPAPTPTPTT